MSTRIVRGFFVVACVIAAATLTLRLASAGDRAVMLPDPEIDAQVTTTGDSTAVLAGGCFWGIQAVFQHVKGVKRATSGYSGGAASTAEYELVGTGRTGHAESVLITYDPSQISYGQLLKIFFSVAHDPTELNRQGPDDGPQYRSAIFYNGEEQHRIAAAYVSQLQQAKVFRRKIVTEITPLKGFYEAEGYHQDYATRHPNDPYIVINDAPKVAHLKQVFPSIYVSSPPNHLR
jgi:peptide-methionine (S)-S-oxide reductase